MELYRHAAGGSFLLIKEQTGSPLKSAVALLVNARGTIVEVTALTGPTVKLKAVPPLVLKQPDRHVQPPVSEALFLFRSPQKEEETRYEHERSGGVWIAGSF